MTGRERQQMQPNYGIIAILLAGAFVSILNSTLLNVALPSMMADFDVNATTIQWLATGYMLINGIIIPTTAYLIQKYSVRQLFIAAMILFTIGTVFAGFAPSFAFLLIGRMIQACGSAIMMPLLMNSNNVAQDLSVAAMTKGLSLPGKHTSMVELKMTIKDWNCMLTCTLPFVLYFGGVL